MASSSQPTQPTKPYDESLPNSSPNPANIGTTETQPKKKQRQTKSKVWEHFHKNISNVVVDGKVEEKFTTTCKTCSREFNANSSDETTRL